MTTYCVGDIQGCDGAFERLLSHVGFSPSRDTLYVLGDLVNRGPHSDAVLRRCMAMEGSVHALLGNHDLHLLAAAHGLRKPARRDTLHTVLQAPDCAKLIDWVRRQPLVRKIEYGGKTLLMVHAGLLPQWDVSDAISYAAEVQAWLCGPKWSIFLEHMYGNTPNAWNHGLLGWERLRLFVNAFTRLRFCTPEGVMDFEHTQNPTTAPPGLLPWFDVQNRCSQAALIAFGHWSALGFLSRPDVLALDTGCVWGGCLSAVRFGATLAERELCSVHCAA